MDDRVFDVLVVGGGPSGLQAALTLGRARKRVLVADGGPRRNAPADHMNNFVSRDGIAPADFRRAAWADLAKYPNVSFRDGGSRPSPGCAATSTPERFARGGCYWRPGSSMTCPR
jgi:thioredoxin reductase